MLCNVNGSQLVISEISQCHGSGFDMIKWDAVNTTRDTVCFTINDRNIMRGLRHVESFVSMLNIQGYVTHV